MVSTAQVGLHRRSTLVRAAEDEGRFRPDVEGLRAVAVLLVVGFHAGLPWLGGGFVGVDVFFVISGFLITSNLVREVDRTGRVSIVGFYARRFARLLPAAAVVMVATVAAAWLWLPPVRFPSIAIDAASAAGYGLNYRLIWQGTDYLTAALAPSPLQHFWSLAVEEQFYLLWPLLLLLACSKVWRGRVNRAAVGAVLGGLTVASLAYCVWVTGQSAPWAYFGLPARAWELGVGALVAVAVPYLARMSARLARVVAGCGLAGVVAAGVVLTEQMPFPGWLALLPVLGAAAIIAGGCAASTSTGRLLGVGVMRGIGRLSYPWYLWHWPVLVIAPAMLNVDLSVGYGLVLAAGSLFLAGCTHLIVEQPVRDVRAAIHAQPGRVVLTGLALSAVLAAAGCGASQMSPTPVGSGTAADATAVIAAAGEEAGAALAQRLELAAGTGTVPANLTPALAEVRRDLPAPYSDGCHLKFADVTSPACIYGDPDATTTVVLVGDSHAAHWFPALAKLAVDRGWRLVSLTKSACTAATARVHLQELKREYTECAEWRRHVFDRIRQLHPTVVVMSSNGGGGQIVGGVGDPDRDWADAWAATFRELKADGTRLVWLQDTPWPDGDVPDCVSTHLADVRACARPTGQAVLRPALRAQVAALAVTAGVSVVDPTPWLCTADVCPVVVDNLLVYRDDSHMTTAYSTLLAPLLVRTLMP